jgi:hypothetical protein
MALADSPAVRITLVAVMSDSIAPRSPGKMRSAGSGWRAPFTCPSNFIAASFRVTVWAGECEPFMSPAGLFHSRFVKSICPQRAPRTSPGRAAV